MSTARQTVVRYAGTFHGEPGQVGRVRAEVRAYLAGCPRADDAVLIASELFFPGFRSVSAPCSG